MAEVEKIRLDLRAESRLQYTSPENHRSSDGRPCFNSEQLRTGAILRIADAQEKMSENFQTLMNERDSFYRMYLEEKNKNTQLRKQIKELKQ